MKFVCKRAAFEDQPPYLVRAHVEDSLVAGWVNLLAHEHGAEIRDQLEITESEGCRLDLGGMVLGSEPFVKFDCDAGTFAMYLRQAEFVVPKLREPSPRSHEFLGAHVWFPMRWVTLICTQATGHLLADFFEAEAAKQKDAIDAAWTGFDKIAVSPEQAQNMTGEELHGRAIAPTRAEQRRRAGLED